MAADDIATARVATPPARSLRAALGRRVHAEFHRRDAEIPERTLDQTMRYEPVLRLVREVGPGTLLDVGSSDEGIAGWLFEPGWSITISDQVFYSEAVGRARTAPDSRRVVADARELPFEDGAFDVTVALDLIEHIDPADRPIVLAEAARVTRRRLVVGCPTGSEALDADRRLADFHRERGAPEPPWLTEHLERGFPEASEVVDALAPHGPVRVIANEAIAAHERVVRFQVHPNGFYVSRLAATALAPTLRRPCMASPLVRLLLSLARGRDRTPTYRTLVCADLAP